MLKTLTGVKNRIVKHYQPEKIILFGSYSKDNVKKDSDIDILIIKDTDKRFFERQIEVEGMLTDRELPLDILVYTPDEVRMQFSTGNPLIEEIMEKGRLLYMRKTTAVWIKDAEEELDSALILFEHEKYRPACYHAQQCVEKGLKALLLESGKRPDRTHDIIDLFNKVRKSGFDCGLIMEEAIFLNSIYKGRYPTEQGLLPQGAPSQKDAERAISSANGLMEKLKSLG